MQFGRLDGWQVGRARGAPSGSGAWRIGLGILALLAVLPYLNALQAGFVFDDAGLVVHHPAVQGAFDPGRILTAPYWGEIQQALLWRPVTTLSFALDHLVAGSSPVWPHAVNLLLHAGVTILWAGLIRKLFRSEALAFVAGALFAVHPLHTEAVTWISGRAEILAALFALLALRLAPGRPRRSAILAPLAVLLAVASKESAAVVPLVLAFQAWAFRGDPERAPRPIVVAASVVPVVGYVILRRLVLGVWGGPDVDPMDNPLAGIGIVGRIPTALDLAGRYLALTLWPARLSVDYSAPVLTMVRGATPFLLLGLIAAAGLVFFAVRRPSRPEGWGSAFTLLTFALASNIPIVIGTILAERLFYLPSAGILLIVAVAGIAAASRLPAARRPLLALLLLLVAAGAVRTWIRNKDYRDDLALYSAGARAQPMSPKMRFNHALELSKRKRFADAVPEAIEALRLNPKSREAREVLAVSLEGTGRAREAIDFLIPVLHADGGDRPSRLVLIRLLDAEGEGARADSVAEAGRREDSGDVAWTAIAAKRKQDRGDFAAAVPLWREAVTRSPESQDAPLYLAYCLLKTGDLPGARDAYTEASRRDPRSAQAANGLAWTILQTGGDPAEAIGNAERAVRLDPQAAPHHDTLARAYLAAGERAKALEEAEKAASLAPQNPDYRDLMERLRSARPR